MQIGLNFNVELTDYQKLIKGQIGTWYDIIGEVFDSPKVKDNFRYIKSERSRKTIYPKSPDVLRAFLLCPPERCRVIIVGQDCYHNGNADGLSFSCKYKVSPSLKIILNVLNKEYNPNKPYTLEHWAEQGVLLLNSSLTVEKGKPGSHSKYWSLFIRECIKRVSQREYGWLLWGGQAKSLKKYIKTGHIIEDVHPMSDVYNETDDFFGGFNSINKWLEKNNKSMISW